MTRDWSNTLSCRVWTFKWIFQIWKERRKKCAENCWICHIVWLWRSSDLFFIKDGHSPPFLTCSPCGFSLKVQTLANSHLLAADALFPAYSMKASGVITVLAGIPGCKPPHPSSTSLIAQCSPVGQAKPKWNTEVWSRRDANGKQDSNRRWQRT